MSNTVEVYTDEYWNGREMKVSEIIKDYPFLKNENLNNTQLTIKEDQITIEYTENTGSDVVVWKRNNMTGKWVDRIIFK